MTWDCKLLKEYLTISFSPRPVTHNAEWIFSKWVDYCQETSTVTTEVVSGNHWDLIIPITVPLKGYNTEHKLLSQNKGILFKPDVLCSDCSVGSLNNSTLWRWKSRHTSCSQSPHVTDEKTEVRTADVVQCHIDSSSPGPISWLWMQESKQVVMATGSDVCSALKYSKPAL